LYEFSLEEGFVISSKRGLYKPSRIWENFCGNEGPGYGSSEKSKTKMNSVVRTMRNKVEVSASEQNNKRCNMCPTVQELGESCNG